MSLIIVAALALVAIITVPLSAYLIGRQLISLGEQHAKQLEHLHSVSRADMADMNDRLMEMVNVHHWTKGTLQELENEQMKALENPKPPIEMDDEAEDNWSREMWAGANAVAEDVGEDVAHVLGAAGVELEVDGLK